MRNKVKLTQIDDMTFVLDGGIFTAKPLQKAAVTHLNTIVDNGLAPMKDIMIIMKELERRKVSKL